jgi:hypothetical protein
MADGAAAAAGLLPVEELGARDESPESLKRRLLYSSVFDALAIGVAVFSATAICGPQSTETIAIASVAGVLPLLLAITTLGLANLRVPFAVVGCAVILLLAAGYVAALVGQISGYTASTALKAFLIVLAFAPPFVALWASARLKDASGTAIKLPVDALSFISVGCLLVICAFTYLDEQVALQVVGAPLLIAAYLLTILPPVVGNFVQARREKRLPVQRGDRQPDHISGLGASTFILFAIVVVTLGLWAAATGAQATISVYAGLIVLLGLIAAFAIVAFGLPASKLLSNLYRLLKAASKPVGWLFSTIDSLLVYAVANSLGANSERWPIRFSLLLGSLIPCAVLGWWLPAPFGLVPLAFALVGTISIARRWAWMEEDRENAMLARKFAGPHIRVGFAQDLKDEALAGFAVLFIAVPIALRQLHLSLDSQAFTIEPISDTHELLAWLSFFGTEMAKAVPFVDWTEIYRVNGLSTIKLDTDSVGVGQHVVFGMRILVDLVLLAAFLQAISITQRTKKLKEMFYSERSMNRLDPFIEPAEFGKLVRAGASGFELNQTEFEAFPVYDPDRLEELKQAGEHTAIGFGAARLLDRDEEGGPEEQLSRESRRAKPDMERCQTLLTALADTSAASLQVGPLKAAHFALNSRPAFMTVRLGIVVQIARATDERQRINALSEVLIGPGAGVQDPRKEVRMVALNALYLPAVEGNRAARGSIYRAATHDPAQAIRREAADMLAHNSDWR